MVSQRVTRDEFESLGRALRGQLGRAAQPRRGRCRAWRSTASTPCTWPAGRAVHRWSSASCRPGLPDGGGEPAGRSRRPPWRWAPPTARRCPPHPAGPAAPAGARRDAVACGDAVPAAGLNAAVAPAGRPAVAPAGRPAVRSRGSPVAVAGGAAVGSRGSPVAVAGGAAVGSRGSPVVVAGGAAVGSRRPPVAAADGAAPVDPWREPGCAERTAVDNTGGAELAASRCRADRLPRARPVWIRSWPIRPVWWRPAGSRPVRLTRRRLVRRSAGFTVLRPGPVGATSRVHAIVGCHRFPPCGHPWRGPGSRAAHRWCWRCAGPQQQRHGRRPHVDDPHAVHAGAHHTGHLPEHRDERAAAHDSAHHHDHPGRRGLPLDRDRPGRGGTGGRSPVDHRRCGRDVPHGGLRPGRALLRPARHHHLGPARQRRLSGRHQRGRTSTTTCSPSPTWPARSPNSTCPDSW